MNATRSAKIRRLATVWWVRNHNRKNHERAARWQALAARYA